MELELTVAGTDDVGGKETWKIYLENTEVSNRCFGSAKSICGHQKILLGL